MMIPNLVRHDEWFDLYVLRTCGARSGTRKLRKIRSNSLFFIRIHSNLGWWRWDAKVLFSRDIRAKSDFSSIDQNDVSSSFCFGF